MHVQAGDTAYYIGTDQRLQQDYGKQKLTIAAIDPKTGRAVCSTADGRLLVGVRLFEIQLSANHTSPAERSSLSTPEVIGISNRFRPPLE